MHYGHPRMPMEERAKIFSPFDPLKGFRDELRRRELKVLAEQQRKSPLPEDEPWELGSLPDNPSSDELSFL